MSQSQNERRDAAADLAVCAAATPGPWLDDSEIGDGLVTDWNESLRVADCGWDVSEEEASANCTFIALARTALPHWINRAVAAEAERERLRAAIVEHHAQRGDDRCWLDDVRLYEAAGLPPADCRVGDKDAMLENCKRFLANRCQGGGWKSYAELEAEIARLRGIIDSLAARCKSQSEALEQRAMRVKMGDRLQPLPSDDPLADREEQMDDDSYDDDGETA